MAEGVAFSGRGNAVHTGDDTHRFEVNGMPTTVSGWLEQTAAELNNLEEAVDQLRDNIGYVLAPQDDDPKMPEDADGTPMIKASSSAVAVLAAIHAHVVQLRRKVDNARARIEL